MTTPFTFSGSLQAPPDPGLPADSVPFNLSSQFSASAEFVLSLTGSGSKSVSLGTLGSPGVKGLFIKVDAGSTVAPVLVRLNAAVAGVEVSGGGFLLLGSPSPVSGVTQLDLDYTTSATVRVWVFG